MLKKNSILIILCMLPLLSGFADGGKTQRLAAKIDTNLNHPGKSDFYFDLRAGLAIPVNASYIDTFENQDIYWNPNSGFSVDLKFTYDLSPNIRVSFPLETVMGFYRYNTTDGRKVNTEAQAGNAPQTINTEWSFAPNFVPMLNIKTGQGEKAPYIGVGAGVGMMWSYETWDYTNNDGNRTRLHIDKFYDPALIFKGEGGMTVPLRKRLGLTIAGTFTLANYIMRKVVLSHYYIAGTDTIAAYDTVDTVYSYGYDVPDENKGGECLLAGFAYNNYPQQKIGTNFNLKIGLTYHY